MLCLIIIHITVCILFVIVEIFKKDKEKRPYIYIVLFLVPIWGILMYFADCLMEKKQDKKELDSLGIETEHTMKMNGVKLTIHDQDNDTITVPLEEAMVVNDASVKRKLMLQILNRNPEDYIDLLQQTRMNDDVELTHFATTAMMEIQGKYEQQLQQYEQQLKSQPDHYEMIKMYMNQLKAYIDSGLITGNILLIYERKLNQLLIHYMELAQNQLVEEKKYFLMLIDNKIAINELESIEDELKKAKSLWPDQEQVYMLYVKYYRKMGRGDKVKAVLDEILESGIYLSKEGKSWYDFWRGQVI